MGLTSEWELHGTNDYRTDFKIVGQWGEPGRQSYDIATGIAKYPRDLYRPGSLYALCLRSPYGHAKVKILDTSEAEALEGVRLVLTYEDEEIASMPVRVSPYFALGSSPVLSDEAECEGDECGAVVVAINEEVCKKALELIKVEWTVLPFILDPREALLPGAPIIRPDMNETGNLGGNTFGSPNVWENGSIDEGFAQADYTEEFDWAMNNFCQMRPMPPSYIAYWEYDPWGNNPGEKMCYVTHQQHFPDMGSVASAIRGLDLDEDHFRALTPHLAARYCDFVEKRGAQLAPMLSRRLDGVPVRVLSSRRHAFDACVPQSYLHARIGFTQDGVITAVQGHNVHQSGLRSGYGDKTSGHLVLPPQVTGFRMTNCNNIYCELEQMLTNGTAATADPGQHQVDPVNMAFGVIANKLKMDITDVMMANMRYTAPSLEACMAAGKEAFDWDAKWHLPGEKALDDGRLHGISARVCFAQTWGMVSYNINLSMRPDGKIYMPYAEGLLGTFWPEAVRMVIAEELGAKLEDVIVYHAPHFPNWMQGDATDRASTATWTAKEAAIKLRGQLLGIGVGMFGSASVDDLDIVDSVIIDKTDSSKAMPLSGLATQLTATHNGRPEPAFDATMRVLRPMTLDFCEVAVDTATGEIEILNYVSTHDFGKVIRLSSALGQLEQPITMSSGRALREQIIWDKNTGVMLNGNLIDYKVPTTLDQPKITTIPVETRCGGGAYGSVGVAHAHCTSVPVSLAFQNATGAFIPQEPFTPAKVLKALGRI
ncbi:MAG: molybdopterin-dependent oxidoreductase [Coriobacteriales bacterium]|jgi:CO/xanthine dehydrogenase Mo-binding subunit|nr:molybdopterin-dependent oxidoreductase [Coriobacteriales bacterium]